MAVGMALSTLRSEKVGHDSPRTGKLGAAPAEPFSLLLDDLFFVGSAYKLQDFPLICQISV